MKPSPRICTNHAINHRLMHHPAGSTDTNNDTLATEQCIYTTHPSILTSDSVLLTEIRSLAIRLN